MGANYLKKYYLDDDKLAQRARLEFFRALETGRMIAFTGSMTTQAFGYGSWDQLRMTFSAIAGDATDIIRKDNGRFASEAERIRHWIDAFEKRSATAAWNTQIGMSLIEEALDRYRAPLPGDLLTRIASPKSGTDGVAAPETRQKQAADEATGTSLPDWPLDQFETLREAVRVELARRFRTPPPHWREAFTGTGGDVKKELDVPHALWHALGIRRFATLNYDFELERVTMRPDATGSTALFDALISLRGNPAENFSWDLGSGRIRRVFLDGWAIESDLLNRERIDRMIEFALGTDDVDAHIMHLHGRADSWHSMVLTQRDYDNLYRRNDLNRAPFEFAKRLMMGGNPILFVGLGMSEQELNSELQEFISNNPYQRVAPTFLLWSTRTNQDAPMSPEKVAAKRLDLLRRLGVLTIFDSDIAEIPAFEPGAYEDLKTRRKVGDASLDDSFHSSGINSRSLYTNVDFTNSDRSTLLDLQDLRSSIDLIAGGLAANDGPQLAHINPTIRERHVGGIWRTMQGRTRAAQEEDTITTLWKVLPPEIKTEAAPPDAARLRERRDALVTMLQDENIVCVVGSQGCGKGGLARAVLDNPVATFGVRRKSDCLLVNGGFAFDTDTILDGVARFLAAGFDIDLEADGALPGGRPRFLSQLAIGSPDEQGRHVLILINGTERFFDTRGDILSAELDELLAFARKKPKADDAGEAKGTAKAPKVRWLFFGTERVRRYMDRNGFKVIDFDGLLGEPVRPALPSGEPSIACDYLNSLWANVKTSAGEMSPRLRNEIVRYEANRSGRITGDSNDLRHAVFTEIFDEIVLQKVLEAAKQDNEQPSLAVAKQLLKALAFIGLPVERDVLALMPGLKGTGKEELDATLAALMRMELVLALEGYRGNDGVPSQDCRHALHRTMLTELRYRYGIPLSEAKLSTAFNMSLYVAQPIDGDIPDTDIHDDLGKAIDQLIGSYRLDHDERDRADIGICRASDEYWNALNAAADACGASDWGLRAGRVRHPVFHSPHCPNGWTPCEKRLLSMERLCGDRHARALRTALALIRSYYSTTGLLTLDSGDRLIREGSDGVLLEHAERLDDLIDAYAKMSLARGSLRKTLGAARADSLFGGMEPFYAEELVWLHNERGVARLAMGDLYEARRSFDRALLINRVEVERDTRGHNWRRIRLNQLTVDLEMGEIGLAERKCGEIIDASRIGISQGLRESELAIAIATGYQGWCLHLRGQAERALSHYSRACEDFSRLGEVRAQAYFERFRANACGIMNRPAEQRATLERALDLAQSAVQMDIVHRLQVTLADSYIFGSEPTPPHKVARAHRYLEEALTYALHTDVHRVRCEASMTTARVRLHMSDYDGALRYATDAMMVATRYGLELRKISLRALVAKIMARRGHPVTAEQLARTCIKMATRQRYQNAIDEASQVILDIPRISAAISMSDKTGRRHF